jgi:hypothetical protein
MIPGTQVKGATAIGGSHPPKNSNAFRADMRIMLAYSPREKRAKPMAEYSTFYPETNSASASGRSKG